MASLGFRSGGGVSSPYARLACLLVLDLVRATLQDYAGGGGAPVYPESVDYEMPAYADADYGRGGGGAARRPNAADVDALLAGLPYGLEYVRGWPAGATAAGRLGQVSAVALDSRGRVLVFHRAEHAWDRAAFAEDNVYAHVARGPIAAPTVVAFNGTDGALVDAWGRDLFYLPHGLAVDADDNVWVTDVALHQVMKFPAGEQRTPSLVLGTRFVPGKDAYHFCKPSGVAVMRSGDFFVADGYCNSRIIKFSPAGKRIAEWGRNSFSGVAEAVPQPYSFAIPHALALAEDKRLVCVADRENGRVQCFDSRNGTFVSQFHSPVIGARLFSVAYAPARGGRLYVVNGPEYSRRAVRGFVIDMTTRKIVAQFAPDNADFANPHDVAVSRDGREVYAVELDPFKVHKFVDPSVVEEEKKAVDGKKDSSSTAAKVSSSTERAAVGVKESAAATTAAPVKPTATVEGLTLATGGWGGWAGVAGGVAGGLGAVLLLLLGGAALLLRARHRGAGCLSQLTPRNRRQRWDYAPGAGAAADFKFRHLLETRGRSAAGFERVNTEESDEEEAATPATSMLAPQNA